MSFFEAFGMAAFAFLMGAILSGAIIRYAIWRSKQQRHIVGDFVFGGIADGALWVWTIVSRILFDEATAKSFAWLRGELRDRLEGR